MALYKCEVTFDVVVDAKDKKSAIKLANSNIHEENKNTGQDPINTTAKIIRKISELSDDWLHSIPWNDENHNKECLDILASDKMRTIRCSECGSTTDLVMMTDIIMCETCAINKLRGKKQCKDKNKSS